MIEPLQVIEVRSPAVGLIQQVHVQRGDIVKKGQLLVTVEAGVEKSAAEAAKVKAQAQGNLQLAKAKLEAAKKKSERNDSLFEDGFVSAQARDDARAEMESAQAEVQTATEGLMISQREYEEASEQVKRRELRSPITGVVMDQFLYPGALVDNSEGKKPILKLAQTNILKVESIVPFAYYETIRVGGKASIIPEAPLRGTFKGIIKVVDHVVDSASGTFGVVVELKNPDHKIPAGVRCKARFESESGREKALAGKTNSK